MLFTLYSLTDLFNRTTSWLLGEAVSDVAIKALTLSEYPLLYIARYSFTHVSELEQYKVKICVQLDLCCRVQLDTAAQDSKTNSSSRGYKAVAIKKIPIIIINLPCDSFNKVFTKTVLLSFVLHFLFHFFFNHTVVLFNYSTFTNHYYYHHQFKLQAWP